MKCHPQILWGTLKVSVLKFTVKKVLKDTAHTHTLNWRETARYTRVPATGIQRRKTEVGTERGPIGLWCRQPQSRRMATHAPALDVVSEGGDVDVHVPRGSGLPSVLLLEGLLIVHISLNIIRERVLPVFRVKTVTATPWLHHSWLDENRSNRRWF